MNFQLSDRDCIVKDVNQRMEKHGDEDVLHVDIKLSTSLPNGSLSMFAVGLAELLYCKERERRSAPDLAQQGVDPEGFTCPRFDELALPLEWTGRMIGATVLIRTPVSADDVEFETCKVNDFKITPRDGGSVDLTFRVQAPAMGSQIGWLSERLRHGVQVSVTPPSSDQIDVER